MNTQRLGCLSPLALLSALITLIVLIVTEIITGNSMFSPGALNARAGETLGGVSSHAQTGKECGKCHAPFWSPERMSDLCLRCHSAILSEMEDPSSLHGKLFQGASAPCQSCHTEHHGSDAALTIMDAGTFPHDVTGFALTKHQVQTWNGPFTCEDCHTRGIALFDPLICAECHLSLDKTYTENHIQAFGETCLACHDGVDRFSNFDHNLSSFHLDGAHINVACTECHKNKVFKGTAAECGDCHTEPAYHAGLFTGQACPACHSTAAWTPARYDGPHPFPMDHGEKNNACADCHVPDLTIWTCTTCHDQAEMEEKHREERISDIKDCLGCHPTGQEDERD
jgi:hypothetical protein